MSEMIQLDGLTKLFGQLTAVDNISLNVDRGQVLGFLGPNGAGKSTTMKMATGFLEPTAGTARIAGFDIITHPVEVKKCVGYLPEGAPTYGDMTPLSFLDFIAEIRGFNGSEKKRRIGEVIEKVRITDVLTQSIDTLSKGYKRRVGLAQAMLHDPDVLILDEPTDGLDPNQKHHVRALISEMAAEKAIIVSTHILEEVEAVCSRAVIIAHGRLLADGTPEELLARDPNHNAVVIHARTEHRATLESGLAGVGDISEIKDLRTTDGEVRLRVTAANGSSIITDVSARIRDKNLSVDELYVEKGAMDEVFRQITKLDAGEEQSHA